MKEKFFTKVYTCLLCIIGSFEIIMQSLIVGFAFYAGEYAIAGLSAVGLISLVTANVVFSIYYQREIVKKY